MHVDRDRNAIAGTGDGASDALALGLANGKPSNRVLAYSPTRTRPQNLRRPHPGRPATASPPAGPAPTVRSPAGSQR
ncbi:hypothetical protein ABZZ36_43235 [Actinacidiphila glaucinigra]|uniref:hypothetical protein n=1 Tax=Actinacidiphila glaucinigra TaxID=235986 RepID=UPI0033B25D44